MSDDPVELFTITEVAALLRLNPKTVERMIRRGDLGSARIGAGARKAIRVRADQLQAFIDARTIDAPIANC